MAFKSKIIPNIGTTYNGTILSPVVESGNTATIIGLSIANRTNTDTVIVTVRLFKNGEDCHIIRNASISVGNALVLVGGDQKLVLEAGDIIYAEAGSNNAADAIISYLT